MAIRIPFLKLNSLGRLPTVLGLKRLSSTTMSADSGEFNYETLAVGKPKDHVYHIELNRPDKYNSLNRVMWREFKLCFDQLQNHPDCRAVVLSGAGRLFTAGIDLNDFAEIASESLDPNVDVARRNVSLLKIIVAYQESFTAIEKCLKPVIAAVHGPCIGAGVDLLSSTDIRYCTQDAWFQVKEVDIGLAADVGTLQRLPRIIGNQSLVRELSLSGRKLFAAEALNCGLVGRVFTDKESMISAAVDLASVIASKSPVAVQGTKMHLNYSRDHTVEEGLQHMAIWNMTMLQSEDLLKSAMAQLQKNAKPALFSNL